MKVVTMVNRVGVAAAGMLLMVTAVGAQQAQPQQRPAQQRPQQPAQQPAQQQPAQQQPTGPTVVNLQTDPNQPNWVKVCGRDQGNNKEVCYTTRDFVAENNTPVLAVAVYDTKGEPQKTIRLLMPLTFLLPPGVRMGVDQGQMIPGRFEICFPNGCFVQANVQEAFITAMKRGTNLTIQAQNQGAREVNFVLPLKDFAKGFDGPPIDPAKLAEEQQRLQKALEEQAEQLRRQQRDGAAQPTAPAAPGQPTTPRQ
jgi:invasion protein IalB